jgi:ferrous iron transport protein B
MGRVGLSGRAFIPLLSSFACAIPGIMAARTIPSRADRLATIMIAPLMTCSARLPVYALLIGALIPQRMVGFLNLRGLVLFALYLAGVLSALGVAFVLKRTSAAREDYRPLLLEPPAPRDLRSSTASPATSAAASNTCLRRSASTGRSPSRWCRDWRRAKSP